MSDRVLTSSIENICIGNEYKYVGGYDLGHFVFALKHKPSWFHRLMVRLILGWKWKESTRCDG